MSMSYITFPLDPSLDFVTNLQKEMFLVQKFVSITLGYGLSLRVERLSFVDYTNKTFHTGFPFDKQLQINNTSTMETFGFGRYNGAFFDVILRKDDGNPLNLKIFYSVAGVGDNEETKQIAEDTSNESMIYILGERRKCFKKGRGTLIEYNGKLITLTEAKKLEKKNMRDS